MQRAPRTWPVRPCAGRRAAADLSLAPPPQTRGSLGREERAGRRWKFASLTRPGRAQPRRMSAHLMTCPSASRGLTSSRSRNGASSARSRRGASAIARRGSAPRMRRWLAGGRRARLSKVPGRREERSPWRSGVPSAASSSASRIGSTTTSLHGGMGRLGSRCAPAAIAAFDSRPRRARTSSERQAQAPGSHLLSQRLSQRWHRQRHRCRHGLCGRLCRRRSRGSGGPPVHLRPHCRC
mmetsp:Transcript_56406/g.181091  ORF Transcript_56406/g.181091 Transcript_56406/m.181091 type:complete len:238 (+) Transcript_56406:323-1036(+)